MRIGEQRVRILMTVVNMVVGTGASLQWLEAESSGVDRKMFAGRRLASYFLTLSAV